MKRLLLAAALFLAAAAPPPPMHVDPSWPKPLPHGWIFGEVSGVATDEQDHVWIIQRPRSPDRRIRAPRRSSSSTPTAAWCRPGAAPATGLRLVHQRARHLRRSQGLRLARRQRRDGRPDPEIHPRRQIRAADRPSRRRDRQQRRDPARPPRRHAARPGRQRALRRRRLWQPPRSSCSTPTPAPTSATGAPMACRRPTTTWPTTRRPRRRASSAIRCIASSCPATAWSMSATARTTASRCSATTAASSPSGSSARKRAALAASGTWPCSPDAAQSVPVQRRWHQRRGAHPAPRRRHYRWAPSAAPAARRAVPLGAQHRRRQPGRRVHHRSRRRQPGAEIRPRRPPLSRPDRHHPRCAS